LMLLVVIRKSGGKALANLFPAAPHPKTGIANSIRRKQIGYRFHVVEVEVVCVEDTESFDVFDEQKLVDIERCAVGTRLC